MRKLVKQQNRAVNSADVSASGLKGIVSKSLAAMAVCAAFISSPAMSASIVAPDAAVQISPAHEMNGVRMVNASMSNIISGASATPTQDVGSRLQFASQFGTNKLDDENDTNWMSASRALAILFVALIVVSLRVRSMQERGNRVH